MRRLTGQLCCGAKRLGVRFTTLVGELAVGYSALGGHKARPYLQFAAPVLKGE